MTQMVTKSTPSPLLLAPDTKKQVSDTKKQVSDTNKQVSDTKKQVSDTTKPVLDTTKLVLDTTKLAPDTKQQVSDTTTKRLTSYGCFSIRPFNPWGYTEARQNRLASEYTKVFSFYNEEDYYDNLPAIEELLNAMFHERLTEDKFYTLYETAVFALAQEGFSKIHLGASRFLKVGWLNFVDPRYPPRTLEMIAHICMERVQGELNKGGDASAVLRMDDFSMLVVRTFCMERIEFSDEKQGYKIFEREFCRRGLDSFAFNKKAPLSHFEKYFEHLWDKYSKLLRSVR